MRTKNIGYARPPKWIAKFSECAILMLIFDGVSQNVFINFHGGHTILLRIYGIYGGRCRRARERESGNRPSNKNKRRVISLSFLLSMAVRLLCAFVGRLFSVVVFRSNSVLFFRKSRRHWKDKRKLRFLLAIFSRGRRSQNAEKPTNGSVSEIHRKQNTRKHTHTRTHSTHHIFSRMRVSIYHRYFTHTH